MSKSVAFRLAAAAQLVASSHRVVALTQAQFDKWPAARKRAYLKDHPTSKFGDGNGKGRDRTTDRLKRVLHPSRNPSQLHPGKSKYQFTDNAGKRHTYSSAEDVAKHHDALYDEYDAALDKGDHERARHLDDHLRGLEHLSRNRTFRAEHGKAALNTGKPSAPADPFKEAAKPQANSANRDSRISKTRSGYHFVDKSGKKHTYKGSEDVQSAINDLDSQMMEMSDSWASASPKDRPAIERKMRHMADHGKGLAQMAKKHNLNVKTWNGLLQRHDATPKFLDAKDYLAVHPTAK